jgi:hypothetical protein
MRERARKEIKSKDGFNTVTSMGGLKSFGDLSDALLKLRENFDSMKGKH